MKKEVVIIILVAVVSLIVLGLHPPDDTWLYPGMVNIGNYYPGAKTSYYIQIHNAKNESREFTVTYRNIERTKLGYDLPPVEAKDWVIITDPKPLIAANETRKILIVLAVPEDVIIESKKWEFGVVAKELGQGFVEEQLACRFLVDMR
jgi:hypothetical protein